LLPADAPMVIQNCKFSNSLWAMAIQGRVNNQWNDPRPCKRIVFRNNRLYRCGLGISLYGTCQHIHIVGNIIVDSKTQAIGLVDLLPGTSDIVIANNTLYGNAAALNIFDDDVNPKSKNVVPHCKNMRFQNNLVLSSDSDDLQFFVHERAKWKEKEKENPGDVKALLKAWQFSHNWREIEPAASPSWVRGLKDTLSKDLRFMHPRSGLEFPPPPKDSELATRGVADGVLPSYVGAVPPEGVKWDWDKTWKALQPK
jgi:hypothetical protein